MTNDEARTRVPILLDVATYIGIATMSLLGISGLATLKLQLIAVGLCLLFGIFYRFFFGTDIFHRNPNLYFGAQTLILTLVFVLGSSATDAFNFLFMLLAIHTAVVLPGKPTIIWITIYYTIVSGVILFTRGVDGVYAILFYLIAYVVGGFFGYTLQELQNAQKKLQELAVVDERNRLARDLHDSVKQQVFAISMQLSAARTSLSETDKAYQSVTEAERLAQQAGAELTTLINALRPPGLESRTLANAIREYVNVWSRQNNISSKMNIDSTIMVNQQTEQVVFRVLQEALANVARHSKADKATVELKAGDDAVVLFIEDNGIGFDTTQITKGIGLDSMKERLATVNGKLEVSNLPSQGTRITAIVRMS